MIKTGTRNSKHICKLHTEDLLYTDLIFSCLPGLNMKESFITWGTGPNDALYDRELEDFFITPTCTTGNWRIFL